MRSSAMPWECATALALLLAAVRGVCDTSAALPSPQGVNVESLNTQYLLKWMWPHQSTWNQTVTFTAQYIAKRVFESKNKQWITVCNNITDTQCDFTAVDLYYMAIYLFRVQANLGKESSIWVQKEFCPDKDANLGPPSKVVVTPVDDGLTVTISDPLTSSNISMKKELPHIYYTIKYWKYIATEHKDFMYFNATHNVVTLLQLGSWTMYCLSVQSRFDFYHKASMFTLPECVQTKGSTPLWQVLLYFLSSMVLCLSCILLPSYAILKLYCLVKHTFFPSCQVPPSLQEPLCDSSSNSGNLSLLTLESEVEICLQKLEVSPEEVPQEVDIIDELDPAELETPHHSWQGSGDSGVYSSEYQSGQSDNQQELVKMVGGEMNVVLNSGDIMIHA